MKRTLMVTALGLIFATNAICATPAGTAAATTAPVAGATTLGVSVMEATEVAMGWSVKKSILGKTVYNDAGEKIGSVQDLIIAPDKNVSYVIVGAGGFVGIGRHDVAIPVAQIKEQGGRLVMHGASKDVVKGMPGFVYATDTSRRDKFVAKVDQDIAKGKEKVADLQKRVAGASSETKAKFEQQITALEKDVKSTEDKLGQMKRAGVSKWKHFEGELNAATERLRKSTETATS